ncbi:HEPN domain-containing protein [Candidatus Woesearchaeota archaeon]|nr:HEPN domain-containing protein [Candidatus Woesearchaeota archaeon]
MKLKHKGKIELVEPSEDIKGSYLIKSQSNIESAKMLLNAEKFEESISLAYYSMYNCIMALFFKCGIKCENHSGSIIIFNRLFKQKELANIIELGKKKRIDTQYYTNSNISSQDCESIIRNADFFNLECKNLIKRLNPEKISSLREELAEALSF